MKYLGHGGKEIVERILLPIESKKRIKELKRIAVTDRVVRECIDLVYGFFTPLQGFMGKADVESVCKRMTLIDGTLWPIPIVFDITNEEIKEKGIKEKDTILLIYYNHALAILEVEEIFSYNKLALEQAVLGTTDLKWSEPLRLDTLSLNNTCVPESHSLPVASHIPLEADTLKRNVIFSYYTHIK